MFPFGKSKKDSFLSASTKEKEEAIEHLVSQITFRSGYYLLLMLATLIVTPGLLLNNVSVIIGGMILAPIMIPTMGIGLSLVTGNAKGFFRSLKVLIFSVIVCILSSALFAMVVSKAYGVPTWIPDQIEPSMYVFIAFCSGMAGAFALVKEDLAPTIAGVAISVSLLPPICAAGIGIAMKQWMLVQNSLVLLAANLIGIALAAAIVFWILGFPKVAGMESKAIKETDK